MLEIYTWHDVERILLLHRQIWPVFWLRIDVFSVEVIIYMERVTEEAEKQTKDFLKRVLRQYYDFEKNTIEIDLTRTTMEICLEETEKEGKIKPFPLFKDFSYIMEGSELEAPELDKLAVPVVAFHSYKGGVGRTLALIAFVREMIHLYGGRKKVLVVDGDLEAPGLTWLGMEQNHYTFSYLDVLGIIGAKGNQDGEMIGEISRLVRRSSLAFQTEEMEVPQYFLPVYREPGQMLDIYSNPERIMIGEENKYIIADTLAQIGKCLHVDAVLVDLRAGFSEYSSPFLFDPRVDKLLVSSTSLQSVMGTNLVIRELRKQRGNEDAIQKILLTMVDPDTFIGSERNKTYELLFKGEEHTENGDIMESSLQYANVTEMEHNNYLIHLSDLESICKKLEYAKKTTGPLVDIVEKIFSDKEEPCQRYQRGQIERFREALHDICRKSMAAEGGDIANMLTTRAVMQLGNFGKEVPRVNILGAKGSGKTYLYAQMVKAQTWETFLRQIGGTSDQNAETLICPVLCTEDRNEIRDILEKCRQRCAAGIPQIKLSFDILTENSNMVKNAIKCQFSEKEWQILWQSLMLDMFHDVSSWEDLQKMLEQQNKRVVFLMDGLENIFENFEKDNSEKCGISTLCRGIVNQLSELRLSNIGIIIFLRKDIAELSIQTNLVQFRSQYMQYELNWTQKDALRLALKLAERAGSISKIRWRGSQVSVENASKETTEEELTRIWGLKMGPDGSKQAYSVRWVLASLSDFNGQLQARDIVRFLFYASSYDLGGKLVMEDRFLMPDDMKQAVRACSSEKFKEVEQEIHQLKSSFQKLQNIDNAYKQIPLLDIVLDTLGSEDRKAMERFGYLKEADGESYLSESIRYALGYNKSRVGGAKLVSLLVNK